MKTLSKLTEAGYTIYPLTFRCQGIRIRRKGYALIKDGTEVFTIEPKSYPKGYTFSKDKWLLAEKGIGGVSYYHNINQVVNYIKRK